MARSTPDHRPTSQDSSLQVSAPELVRLRWVAVIGQLVTVAGVRYFLDIQIPMLPLSVLIAATALSNVVFVAWVSSRRKFRQLELEKHRHEHRHEHRESELSLAREGQQEWTMAMILTLDLILLTAMLYFTGGITNPFSVFYLVNLGLASFVVTRGLAWCLFGVAAIGYASLMFFHVEIPGVGLKAETAWSPSEFPVLGWGSFLAFLTCSSVIVHFSSRIHSELQRRESELRLADEKRARNEKLEALGTLAAGAAHELATPLSTIAVVVKELERSLAQTETSDEVRDDMSLIRREVDRCRRILDRMAGDAGQPSGEPLRICSIRQLLQNVVSGLSDLSEVHLQLHDDADAPVLRLPLEAMAQAIRGLVQNGLDASPKGLSVVVSASVEAKRVSIRIRDRGAGMPETILKRISEPFFTTKPPGAGMGLGVFLARTLIERLGGTLSFESAPLHGTVAIVELPTSSSL